MGPGQEIGNRRRSGVHESDRAQHDPRAVPSLNPRSPPPGRCGIKRQVLWVHHNSSPSSRRPASPRPDEAGFHGLKFSLHRLMARPTRVLASRSRNSGSWRKSACDGQSSSRACRSPTASGEFVKTAGSPSRLCPPETSSETEPHHPSRHDSRVPAGSVAGASLPSGNPVLRSPGGGKGDHLRRHRRARPVQVFEPGRALLSVR